MPWFINGLGTELAGASLVAFTVLLWLGKRQAKKILAKLEAIENIRLKALAEAMEYVDWKEFVEQHQEMWKDFWRKRENERSQMRKRADYNVDPK